MGKYLYDSKFGVRVGEVGKKSTIKDTGKRVLYVGDLVNVYANGEFQATTFVIEPRKEDAPEYAYIGVCGIHSISNGIKDGVVIDSDFFGDTKYEVTRKTSFENVPLNVECMNIAMYEEGGLN